MTFVLVLREELRKKRSELDAERNSKVSLLKEKDQQIKAKEQEAKVRQTQEKGLFVSLSYFTYRQQYFGRYQCGKFCYHSLLAGF